jgi:hypothetical protein
MNNIPLKYHAKIRQMIKKAREDEEQRIKHQLTHSINKEKMLDGWERYWIDVGDSRYVENCIECENADKIINLIKK